MINVKKYMTMTCLLERSQGRDEDFMCDSWSDAERLKCFRYGKLLETRDAMSSQFINSQVYILENSSGVKVEDRIDGHIVHSVNEYNDFNGEGSVYECTAW